MCLGLGPALPLSLGLTMFLPPCLWLCPSVLLTSTSSASHQRRHTNVPTQGWTGRPKEDAGKRKGLCSGC